MASKILIITSDDWYFLSHRLPMAEAAKTTGMDVIVVTSGGTRVSEIEALGYRHIQLNAISRKQRGPIRFLKTIGVLRRLLDEEKPDIVLNVGLRISVFATTANLGRGKPVIVNLIAGLGYLFTSKKVHARIMSPAVKIMMRFLFRRPNVHLVTQNKDNFEFFDCDIIGNAERITLIAGSGVDPNRFKSINQPDHPLIVTLAGRMIWSKGIREFIAAAAILKERYKDIRMILVGAPDAANRESIPLETLQSFNENGLIEWWGFQTNIAEVWNKTAIAVVPTWYGEGIPKVLLEAGACERPVIVSDISGCNDVIKDGVNGLLIPPRDAGALADAISRLIESPEERKIFGQRLMKTVRSDHTDAVTHKATADLLKNLQRWYSLP